MPDLSPAIDKSQPMSYQKTTFVKNYIVSISFLLFIAISAIIVYGQVRRHDFVSFDDNEYIYENPRVKSGVTLGNVIWAFTAFHSNNWHPLTWISHMMDCQLFGLNPGPHHLINLFFHIANSLLLFLVFKQMTGHAWKSGCLAALFALHPLHVESVAWISERKDVLSAFFWMLTTGCYIRYVRRPGLARYALALSCFILGLLSKPMLVTLPFTLFLLDYWPLNRLQCLALSVRQNKKQLVRLIVEKIPLLLLVPISCFLTFYAQKHGGVVKSIDVFPLQVRIANAVVSYISYIGKMIFPVKLAFLYPHHGMPPWWKILGAFLLIITLSFLAVKTIKKHPYILVGWLWYLGTLIPVIGIVQVGMQAMADRYTYIPSIGLLIIAVWGIPEVFANRRNKRIWTALSAVTAISIYAGVAWKQVGYWKNSISMLEHTLAVTSRNHVALDSLGVERFKQGKLDEAMDLFLQADRIFPDNPYTHFNMGVALYVKGNTQEAVDQYLEAVRIEPNYFQAYSNLGAACFSLGKTEEAIKHYSKAITIKPDFIDAYINLGIAWDTLGKFENAIQHYTRALHYDPNNVNAHYHLAVDLEKVDRVDEAMSHYSETIRLRPDFFEAHYRLGVSLYKQGRMDEAMRRYSEVLRINPDFAEAHNNLGVILYRKGRVDEAIDRYLKALRLKPDYAEAYNNLGGAYFLKGDAPAAVSAFRAALRINPEYESAKKNLQQVSLSQQ
jgi:tetratricopeptide (TPR) repeat protein